MTCFLLGALGCLAGLINIALATALTVAPRLWVAWVINGFLLLELVLYIVANGDPHLYDDAWDKWLHDALRGLCKRISTPTGVVCALASFVWIAYSTCAAYGAEIGFLLLCSYAVGAYAYLGA
jgi:hypothetical protein